MPRSAPRRRGTARGTALDDAAISYVLSSEGKLIDTIPGAHKGKTIFSHPIGNTIDSQGNVWVANSDWLDAPCPTNHDLGSAANPSVTMIQGKDRKPHPGSPFAGGGITLPWGVAVDGDDTVWVFNFGAVPPPTPADPPPHDLLLGGRPAGARRSRG